MQPKVLLIDDDERTLSTISRSLSAGGFRVHCLTTAPAPADLSRIGPDAVVLDWMLGDLSGLAWLADLRKEPDFATLPVLMLSGRDTERERVAALTGGADDFLAKPPSLAELAARLRNLVRRFGADRLRFADAWLEIDVGAKRLLRGGAPVTLTGRQWEFLACLLRHPDGAACEQLAASIWGPSLPPSLKRLHMLALRLRRAIEPVPERPRYIVTGAEGGYRFAGRDGVACSV